MRQLANKAIPLFFPIPLLKNKQRKEAQNTKKTLNPLSRRTAPVLSQQITSGGILLHSQNTAGMQMPMTIIKTTIIGGLGFMG